MITPDNLRTAHGILNLVGLGKFPESKAAAGLIAVHLAHLPPEPEMWGNTIEPMSSEDHMHAAAVDACRTIKAVGWVPDAMTVAILATAHVGNAYAAWTRPTVHTWCAEMREGLADKLRDLAGVATVSADEGADLPDPPTLHDRLVTVGARPPTRDRAPMRSLPPLASPPPQSVQEMIDEDREDRHTTTPGDSVEIVAEGDGFVALATDIELASQGETAAEAIANLAEARALLGVDTTVPDEAVTATPIVGHIVDVVSVEDPDFSPTGAAEATPAPKKPRCGLTHGWYETEPPRPMLCNRVQGHKGKCGPVKAGEKAEGSAQ